MDKVTLDNSLSQQELSDFFSRLQVPFDYQALVRKLCPNHGHDHGLNRGAFLELWRAEAGLGETDVYRWFEAWGYTRDELWPTEARTFVLSMHSMDPISVQIGRTERGLENVVSVMINNQKEG